MSRHDAQYADEAFAQMAAARPAGRPAVRPRNRPAPAIRRRMAEEITRCLSMTGSVTEDNMARAGFAPADLAAHFRAALVEAGAERMVGA